MSRFVSSWRAFLVGVCSAASAFAQPQVIDNFDDLASWQVSAADGVEASIAREPSESGQALRLDFDFRTGAGFCVVRKEVPLELPANYRFSFRIRGQSAPNNLEFKLADTEGDDVWWVNRRAHEFSTDWVTLNQKKRHFQFAWGPSGGAPLQRISAIEFAVASAEGGAGSIWIDDLIFEPLPETTNASTQPALRFSSFAGENAKPPLVLPDSGQIDWQPTMEDRSPSVTIDFGGTRELGGLALDWVVSEGIVRYSVLGSQDNQNWQKLLDDCESNGGREYRLFTEGELRFIRLDISRSDLSTLPRLKSLKVLPVEAAESPNVLFRYVAKDAPRGWYPRYFLGEQQPWTVVGSPGDTEEALMDVGGAVEIGRRGFRIEPFLFLDGKLITWADVQSEVSLLDGYLPVPIVKWSVGDLDLEIMSAGLARRSPSSIEISYRLTNRSAMPKNGALYVACRPFQVLPPWHELNLTGGVGRIDQIASDLFFGIGVGPRSGLYYYESKFMMGTSTFQNGEIVEYIAKGKLPSWESLTDPHGWGSAALEFQFALEPGETNEHCVEAVPDKARLSSDAHGSFELTGESIANRAREEWTERLNLARFGFAGAKELEKTFKTVQSHILINADGPAIQPGSRTYERSWIRDGAITSTALLYTGHFKEAVDFLDWYGKYQFPNGKIPCVVDRRGPDPVDEHDSTGEYIYLVLQCYRFTRDRTILERHWPRVVAGVKYIEELRSQRMTEEFRDGPPEKRACYGLVPESISHEGYSAKPMHSYWDDLWVLRGLTDATEIARILKEVESEKRFSKLRDDFRRTLYDSMRLAMQTKNIDFIPGCVELGDFDATSTATGVFPCDELEFLPQPALNNTFDRYMKFFRDRRDGRLEWEAYTPYEIRIASTLLRMGRSGDAHELLDFFLKNRLPDGWNQWPEVTWRDPLAPKFVGDMPHTWVGSEFICAVRSLFVYEDDQRQQLVLNAGVKSEWVRLPGGVSIEDFPTAYGRLSYRCSYAVSRGIFEIAAEGDVPPGGFLVHAGGRIVSIRSEPDDLISANDERHFTLMGLKGRVIIHFDP